MNRLQKKCFIVSAGFHLSLALLMLIGPAFLSSGDKPVDVPLIDFIPLKTTDANMSGGGNPKAQLPPPPATPAPQPPQQRPEPPAPEPKVERNETPKDPDPPKQEAESLEPAKERKHKIVVNTTLVRRSSTSSNESKARAESEARARADAQRRAAAAAINSAVTGIQGGLSGSTSIELRGPGGGGVPYGNWLQAVKKIYTDAWILTDGITDDSATTLASITIARDGTVISAEIVRASGNAAVDHSVKMALERVRQAAPLPDEAKESQRTVTISFNAKAKLLG